MSAKFLKIEAAGICFRVRIERPRTYLYLKRRFKNFLSKRKPDFTINFIKPDKDLKISRELFEELANNPQSLILIKSEEKYFFSAKSEPSKTIGFIDRNRNECLLYDLFARWPGSFFTDFILFCFYLFFGYRNSFMLHACGFSQNNDGYIFCGPSGSGKSTVARMSKGSQLLSDERLTISKNGEGFYVYGMPWGKAQNSYAKLKGIFFLNRGKKIAFKRLKPSLAASRIIHDASLFLDASINANILDSVIRVVDSVPCYEMYFSLESPIWEKMPKLN